MSIVTQLEREENAIEEAVERGDMTRREASEAYRELYRDVRMAADEAADQARDEEFARW